VIKLSLVNRPILAIFIIMLLADVAFGHGTTATSADVALDEKLGAYIPADATFLDETGKTVDLGTLIDKPTIIAPVYLHCMHECPLLLTGLAEALGKLQLVEPGRDFRVVALSFDERDTPAIASEKKKNYLKAVRRPFPPEAWSFLTGDNANIRKFTDSVGFKYQKDGGEFSHPLALIVVAPGGKVVRYLYGTSFLPFSVTMAVTEAAEGKVGSTAGRVLTYCFSYDPLKKSYVFNILKVAGSAVVLFVASFFTYLLVTTKKRRGTV
jgi:protein SCO1/2